MADGKHEDEKPETANRPGDRRTQNRADYSPYYSTIVRQSDPAPAPPLRLYLSPEPLADHADARRARRLPRTAAPSRTSARISVDQKERP
jgi:hypothetical protein